MTEKPELRAEEAEALRDIEKLIGKPIPLLRKNFSFGVKIYGDYVRELKLDGQILEKLGLKKLEILPKSIENLTSLKLLYLRDHNLTTIPESIGNLKSLRYLNFRSNKLETISESIGNLKLLTHLNLENNPLKNIPESMGNLKSLKELYLTGMKLTVLPESIGNLSSLIYLSLGNNQLTILPESIGNLSSLRTLWLGENQLEVLPETMGNLKSLKTLGLISNKLSTLPESFKNLTSLKSLFLEGNRIMELPKAIIELKSLQTLKWGDLPSEALISEIEEAISPRDSDKEPVSLRRSIMGELKKKVIPAHRNGTYLEKPDEEELKAREAERLKRLEELKEVEKQLKKSQQVKFLASIPELENIKYYSQLSGQSQSEFIRSAIRDKIKLLKAQSNEEILNEHEDLQEDKLNLEELKRIRNILERLEKKEN